MKLEDRNFSLVLSGGGALGIAHLGVLADLEKQNLIPNDIVGTSMGGIIAACLAIGLKEKEIYKYICEFANVFNWIQFSFSGNSIIKSSKIDKIFTTIFKNLKISDTKIPLKLIATNLIDGSMKVFDTNCDILIKDALLATMAIPGIFEEKEIDGKIYVDGFLCSNLCVSQAKLNNVLAIDVLGKNSFENKLPHSFLKTKNVIDMWERSLRLFVYNQTKNEIKHTSKNIVLIEPNTSKFKTFQFHKHQEIKEMGKNLLV